MRQKPLPAKHKDLAANAKGRLFGKLAKEIMIAARSGRTCSWDSPGNRCSPTGMG